MRRGRFSWLDWAAPAGGSRLAAVSAPSRSSATSASACVRRVDRMAKAGRSIRVHRVRLLGRALVRQVPGLQRVRDARRGGRREGRRRGKAPPKPLLRLVDVEVEEARRISTGVPELDRVLGGGLVPASLVLVGGEPGVGKSTLLLTALQAMSADRRTLLITGEESVAQVKLRAERLGGAANVEILAETELDIVCETLETRAARRLRDRLGADALLGRARLGARLGRAGARGGGAPAARREGERRRDDPRRPRDEGRLGRRARACSSISSTASSSSRATAIARTACCAPSRTASARRTSSASSR